MVAINPNHIPPAPPAPPYYHKLQVAAIKQKEATRRLELYREFKSLFSRLEELVDFNPSVLENGTLGSWKGDMRSLQDKIDVARLTDDVCEVATIPSGPVNRNTGATTC